MREVDRDSGEQVFQVMSWKMSINALYLQLLGLPSPLRKGNIT